MNSTPIPPARIRLQNVLRELALGQNGRAKHSLTVTELCRRAGVSRNSLYRYHGEILTALRQKPYRARRPRTGITVQREESADHALVAKLAALVEYYHRAYRDTLELLSRRDRELAELRRGLKIKPVILKS